MRTEFVPDPAASRAEMTAQQRDIADAATFADDFAFDCDAVGTDTGPLVAGVDQAFLDDRAVSAIVVTRGDSVVERAHAVSPLSIPYIPGLLSFREGNPILAAFEELETEPDCVLFDGSGRIHFRQAGLATHIGVVLDIPSVGVAKNLLCGTPEASTDGLRAGERVGIDADGDVDAPAGTRIGYAVQTKQYDSPNRHVNPLYVSPGHRVSAETAADWTLATSAGYKLPEPTRLADAHAADVKRTIDT
ncbi:endonuclease V [Haloarchaeobius salinus]|uniref:endonuclease V n=1 Tax=Haloarchaeobius salinus TaxID=1198298 RepID=UPI00210D6D01|nr:endonuclease V [Haloarchaeobius salinus]